MRKERLTPFLVLICTFSSLGSIEALLLPPRRQSIALSPLVRLHETPSGGDFFDEISSDSPDGIRQDDPNPDSFRQVDADGSDEEGGQDIPYTARMTNAELTEMAGDWDSNVPKFNRVVLTGRVGQDPDPRYFDDGKVVVNLGLAVKRKYDAVEWTAKGMKTGDSETDWFGLTLWGRDAEFAAKYVTKGARIGVSGNLSIEKYTDKVTGQPRTANKIIVTDLDILETKAEADLRKSKQRNRPSFETYQNDDDEDDDDFGPLSTSTGGFFDS